MERKIKNKSKIHLVNVILYYFRFILFLYRLPFKLRLKDVERLTDEIAEIRNESDKELEEYLEYLHETHPEYWGKE